MERARELFFRYDGSGFYMWHDGVDREYRQYAVPPDVERKWRQDLTAEKIAQLDQPGNWLTLNYLCHHDDTSYLHEVVRAEPRGELWKRVSYLEYLLDYIGRCVGRYSPDEIHAAVRTLSTRTASLDIDSAPEEERQGREEQLRGRARKLAEAANRFLAEPEPVPPPRPRPRWLERALQTFRRT